MAWQIQFTSRAARQLQKLPVNVAKTIRAKIGALANDPHVQNNNVTRLQGEPAYRLRVGAWRVIYELHDATLVVLVMKVGSRGDIYR